MQPSHAQAVNLSAVDNNKKLFALFAKKLGEDDVKVFKDHADRLTAWLRDDRAYYTEARPEILNILTTAYSTVRRNAAPDLEKEAHFHISKYFNHPMIDPYSRLLQQVFQHQQRFQEKELRQRLQYLFSTVLRNACIDLTQESPELPQVKTNATNTHTLSQPSGISGSMLPTQKSTHINPDATINPEVHYQAATASQTSPINPVQIHSHIPQPSHPDPTSKRGSVVQLSPNPPQVTQQARALYVPVSTNSSVGSLGPSVATSTVLARTANESQPGESPRPGTTSRSGVNASAIYLGYSTHPSSMAQPQIPVSQSSPHQSVLPSPFTAGLPASLAPGFTHTPVSVPVPRQLIALTEQGSLDTTSRPTSEITHAIHGQTLPTPKSKPSLQTPIVPSSINTHQNASALVASPVSLTQTLPAGTPSSPSMVTPRFSSLPIKSPVPPAPVRGSTIDVLAGSLPVSDSSITGDSIAKPHPNRSVSLNQISSGSVTSFSESPTSQMAKPLRRTKRKSKVDLKNLIAADIEFFTSAQTIKPEPLDDAHLLQVRPECSTHTAHNIPRPVANLPIPSATNHSPSLLNTLPNSQREVIVISDDEDIARMPAPAITAASDGRIEKEQAEASDSDLELNRPEVSNDAVLSQQVLVDEPVFTPEQVHSSMGDIPVQDDQPQEDKIPQSTNKLAPAAVIETDAASPLTNRAEPHGSVLEPQASNAMGSSEPKSLNPVITTPGNAFSTALARRPDIFDEASQCAASVAGQAKKCTIRLHIPVDAQKYDAVTAWRERRRHSEPLENSLCYTLWCFPVESKVALEHRPKLEPSVWPINGHLTMQTNLNGKKVSFPMSPPFLLGPHGMVDVTDFIDLQAENTKVELIQTVDMSMYRFVLRLHPPLQSQLDEALERRKKDSQWKKWKSGISAPFQVPLPSLMLAY